jgi:hypothetical protein
MTLPFRTTLLPFVALVAAVASAVLAPAANATVLVGAESSRELVNSTQTPELQAIALDKMKAQGTQVVRANFRWYEIANGCGGQSVAALKNPDNACYDWSRVDGLVGQARARGMKLLLSVQQSPTWANGSINPYAIPNATAAFNTWVTHFAAFHTAAATRYRAGSAHGVVNYWTVYNEPNSAFYWGGRTYGQPSPGWQGKPDPKRYALLYARTAVAIKAAYPGAKVAPGPTGPTGGSSKIGGMQPLKFWRGFQKEVVRYLPAGSMAKKRTYIDAVATNPYPGIRSQPHVSAGFNPPDVVTMSTIDRIFKQLDRAPITKGKLVWATEFGWQTSGLGSVNQAQQAQFIAEAFDWLDSKRRVQIGISYGLSDPGVDLPGQDTDWQSGTFTFAGVAKKSFYMYQRMVSVPQAKGRMRRGTVVRVWGRANLSPSTGVLSYRIRGKKCNPRVKKLTDPCVILGQRKDANKAIRANLRLTMPGTYEVMVYSKGAQGVADGYGPSRTFVVR